MQYQVPHSSDDGLRPSQSTLDSVDDTTLGRYIYII